MVVIVMGATRSGLFVIRIIVQKDSRGVVVDEVQAEGSPQTLHVVWTSVESGPEDTGVEELD